MGPRLPRELFLDMDLSPQQQKRSWSKNGGSNNKSRLLSRKDARKAHRQAKKERQAIHHGRKRQVEEIGSELEVKKVKLIRTAAPANDLNLERFAKSNPALYKRLKDDRLLDDESSPSFDTEDRLINHYAKKLGMKDRDTVGESFKKDGLDFILDCDVIKNYSNNTKQDNYVSEKTESDGESELDEELNSHDSGSRCESAEDFEQEFSDARSSNENEDGEYDDSFEEFGSADESFDVDEVEFECSSDQNEQDADEIDSNEDTGHIANEGRTPIVSDNESQKNGNVEMDSTAKKYVPPHLRQTNYLTKSEAYERLQRQIQGHLNRLSESNIEPIFTAIEEIFRSNPRHDVTEIVCDLILTAIADQANLLESHVATYASLISLIYNVVGTDVGATFIQTMVECFEKCYQEQQQSPSDLKETGVSSKKCNNLSVLIAYLYNFRVIANTIVVDLILEWVASLTEMDVEMILKVVRIVGHHLRGDNPSGLKQIVLELQTRATNINTPSVRFKLMVEQVLDLKNNRNMKKLVNTSSQQASTVQDQLKKFSLNYLRRRQLASHEPLGCSLDDVRSVETKGKWWVVGAAWVGRQASSTDLKPLSGACDLDEQKTHNLLKLAKRMNINTEVRRCIFLALMSSEDFTDAFEKILKLGLKDRQEREVNKMIVYCNGFEKAYNPFYATLGERLCRYSHNHKITFQFTLWDMLKEMAADPPPLRQVFHHADLYAMLILSHSLSLSILKVVDYVSLNASTTGEPSRLCLFLQRLMLQCMLRPSTEDMIRLFQRANAAQDMSSFRKGLIVFLTGWIRKRIALDVQSEVLAIAQIIVPDRKGEELKAMIKERIKIVKEVLLSDTRKTSVLV